MAKTLHAFLIKIYILHQRVSPGQHVVVINIAQQYVWCAQGKPEREIQTTFNETAAVSYLFECVLYCFTIELKK